jgi:hypothetical protein
MTAQRPQAHSGGHGAWHRGARRRIGFPASDGAHGCSTTDIMLSSGSRTEQGWLLELVSRRVLMGGSQVRVPIEVRVSDGRVPHGKLRSFITMGKMVFSTCT